MDGYDRKLVLFLKLGYAEKDIRKVLEKLGEKALDNDVLQELILTGNRVQTERDASPRMLMPRLVARGCISTGDTEQRNHAKEDTSSNLRAIVIDGSNVAMSHGCKTVFSCKGIEIAVDWFRKRGHDYIKVFVPSWRKEQPRIDSPISDKSVLDDLEKKMILVYTPSRKINGKRIVCYDDRYIVKLAYEKDAIIVSNDNYRDLQSENVDWKRFIEKRLLMYSFVNDRFMPPDDPLGCHGPTLTHFLKKTHAPFDPGRQLCPYGQKCTYGIKCKFSHPERLNQQQLSVADELRAKTKHAFIESEHCNELLTKGQARFNPVFCLPSCYKWPERFMSTKEMSPSLKMKQMLCHSQKREQEYSDLGKLVNSGIHQGLPVNILQQNKPTLHRQVSSTEYISEEMQTCQWMYAQPGGEQMHTEYRRTDLDHCCKYNCIDRDYNLISHTHSMDCTCIQQHHLPCSFLSETHHNSHTENAYCKHQESRQFFSLHEHGGHSKSRGIHIQCQRMDTLLYQGNVKESCDDPNDHGPTLIKPTWTHGYFTENYYPSPVIKNNCRLLSDTDLYQRKDIYSLLCGLYPNAEVDQAMAANPGTTNILELATFIQKNKRS